MGDRYRLLDVQGHGTSGIVFRAFDNHRNHDVAMKFLKSQTLEDKRQLKHEATLLELFRDEFVLQLLDHEVDNHDPYIVTEYCDHGSLRHWVGRLHWRNVVSILRQVIQGLKNIHDLGGLHCDLKPENLLVKSTPNHGFVVKIADLGIARVPGLASASTHLPKGTRGYMAPEIIEGQAFSSASDIFSLGIVATELLTGSREPHRIHATKLPASLRNLMMAMTNPHPENRPPLQKMSRALEAVQSNGSASSGSQDLEIN